MAAQRQAVVNSSLFTTAVCTYVGSSFALLYMLVNSHFLLLLTNNTEEPAQEGRRPGADRGAQDLREPVVHDHSIPSWRVVQERREEPLEHHAMHPQCQAPAHKDEEERGDAPLRPG
jgi:hypothetical protein